MTYVVIIESGLGCIENIPCVNYREAIGHFNRAVCDDIVHCGIFVNGNEVKGWTNMAILEGDDYVA